MMNLHDAYRVNEVQELVLIDPFDVSSSNPEFAVIAYQSSLSSDDSRNLVTVFNPTGYWGTDCPFVDTGVDQCGPLVGTPSLTATSDCMTGPCTVVGLTPPISPNPNLFGFDRLVIVAGDGFGLKSLDLCLLGPTLELRKTIRATDIENMSGLQPGDDSDSLGILKGE
uniref:Uncharacterized protein n=1 Tax=Chromera velia CCMP2878 TaxID=1169474 RepID=A0A0G4H6R3_9ALVE|eukprot:Cvel_24909.t1-p1 / transcript=Cvel_24909.t1 / gene=Cvel_24909 / organism=Chromera_velia_CCMP2878 / gene_product=hypothetical protein / transcript_product=hypothetical protein / location=Cvel_scaffold2755:17728-19742(-) / protein_length=167 / sequence_SO=supercontig / SO=protein_coding / is_pseudo=false